MAESGKFDRAARHLSLPQVGERGQQRIADSSALLIGVGGIGCAVSQYLASSGVGRLVLVDFDTVDASNLGRQILYTPGDIGKPKVECAAARLRQINPDIDIETINARLDGHQLAEQVANADIVLDGCDNFSTRFAINDACVANKSCLVSGAAIRFEGQLAVFGPEYDASPCYRCLYNEADESLDNCAGNGVMAPIPGVIGTMMAGECLKILAGADTTRGRLSLYDGLHSEWRTIYIRKRENCPGCGSLP